MGSVQQVVLFGVRSVGSAESGVREPLRNVEKVEVRRKRFEMAPGGGLRSLAAKMAIPGMWVATCSQVQAGFEMVNRCGHRFT